MSQNQMISKAEDVADNVLRKTKFILPHLGRFCLVSTFVEDGIRMWMQWGEQRDYISNTWGCGALIGAMFVLINMVGQIGACIGVLIRKQVPIMCGTLFFIIGLQTIAYSILWDIKFLARNLALVGAVLLLLAESKAESRSLFAGVPQLDRNTPKSYMQLSGRVLLVLMFMTLLHFTFNPVDICRQSDMILLQSTIGGAIVTKLKMIVNLIVIVVCVAMVTGYRIELVCSVATVLLAIVNICDHDFWNFRATTDAFDDLKREFFTFTTICGALMLIVHLGAGEITYQSVKDHYKSGL